jgi:hypothetical protein
MFSAAHRDFDPHTLLPTVRSVEQARRHSRLIAVSVNITRLLRSGQTDSRGRVDVARRGENTLLLSPCADQKHRGSLIIMVHADSSALARSRAQVAVRQVWSFLILSIGVCPAAYAQADRDVLASRAFVPHVRGCQHRNATTHALKPSLRFTFHLNAASADSDQMRVWCASGGTFCASSGHAHAFTIYAFASIINVRGPRTTCLA